MHVNWSFLRLKIALAMKTAGWVLGQWRYALLALSSAFIFFELIYWLFNLSAFTAVMTSSNLGLATRLKFVLDPLFSLGSTNGFYTGILMVLVSLVQGMSIAVLVYTIRHQQTVDAALVGGSGFVGLLAVIGLGCPSCGTSLLTPLIALFVSGSTVAIAESLTLIALPIALAIGLYGLYAVSLRAASARASSR